MVQVAPTSEPLIYDPFSIQDLNTHNRLMEIVEKAQKASKEHTLTAGTG
jgi:hypothetical protein